MSATSVGVGRAGIGRQRASTLARTLPTSVVGGFITSRAVVLGAGIAGALTVRRVSGWSVFDPTRITSSLGSVGNVLAAPAVRWDSIHYLQIAQQGYRSSANTLFFPLYPLLMRGVGFLIGSDVVAGVAISTGAFLVALCLLHRLTELELGSAAADAAVVLMSFAPLSFFFSAVYTESLFLALSLGSLYAARKERLGLAAMLAALATLTRVSGVLLVIPIVWWQLRSRRRLQWSMTSTLVAPGALVGFLVYLSASGYSLLAPFQGQVARNQHAFTGPIAGLVDAISAGGSGARALIDGSQPIYRGDVSGVLGAGAESLLLLGVLFLATFALVGVFRRLPSAYGIYASLALLVCIWSPVTAQPLQSLDRYVLTLFPLWMVAGGWLSERRLMRPAIVLSAALLAFYTFEFASWAFIA